MVSIIDAVTDALRARVRAGSLEPGTPLAEVEIADMRFHRSLIDAVGSERTSRLYDSLASEVVFCMSQVQGASLLSTGVIADEHAQIMRLIEAGDGDASPALLSVHLGRARERLAERRAGSRGPRHPLRCRDAGRRITFLKT